MKFKVSLVAGAGVLLAACAQQPATVWNASGYAGTVLVRPGDTVLGIAHRYGVPFRSIVEANDLAPPYRLLVGQTLLLPGASATGPIAADRPPTFAATQPRYLPPRYYAQPQPQPAPPYYAPPPYGPPRYERPSAEAPPPYPAPRYAQTAGDAPPEAPPPDARPSPDAPRIDSPEVPPPEHAATGIAAAPPPERPAMRIAALPPEHPATRIAALPPEHPATRIAALPPKRPAMRTEPPVPAPSPSVRATVASIMPPREMPPAPQSRGSGFIWPVHGHVVEGYGNGSNGTQNDGINIAARAGAPVYAAAAGEVVYVGNELRGYGNLVLIRHQRGYLTAYAHNSTLLVRKGDHVARGQTIALVGATGQAGEPQLHFEIRYGRNPVDPMQFLPPERQVSNRQ